MDFSLVSIIVPVFQVQEYIGACLDSLLGQTYENIEILLVDDGSADASGRMCDEYARTDARIRVCHQENKGRSGARNTGLRMAKGAYIAFVDADDCVSPVYIEELYRLLLTYGADIAVCGYSQDMEGLDRCLAPRPEGTCLDAQRMLRQWHGKQKRLETVVWNKLYRREVLLGGQESVLFPEGRESEDIYVSHRMVQNAGRVVLTGRKLYAYQRRAGSFTHSRVTEDKACQNLEAQLARLEFFQRRGMKGSCRRLLVGLLLHYLMYSWKLRGRWDPPVRKLELIKYMFDAMM